MATQKKTTLLIWKGGDPYPGWPASDHEEPDPELYQAKLASHLYRSPDDKEDTALFEQQRVAKAEANLAAERQAEEAARRAQAIADAAAKDAAEKRANVEARKAAVRRSVKEIDDGTN